MTTFCSRRSRQQFRDIGHSERFSRQPDQDVAASKSPLMGAKTFTQHPFHPVAVYGTRKYALGNNETEPRDTQRICLEEYVEPGALYGSPSCKQPGNVGCTKSLPATVTLAQTLKRARPLARRARSTARPPRVRIRTRKPWVRFLRITEG
jgi:hypothetical protein